MIYWINLNFWNKQTSVNYILQKKVFTFQFDKTVWSIFETVNTSKRCTVAPLTHKSILFRSIQKKTYLVRLFMSHKQPDQVVLWDIFTPHVGFVAIKGLHEAWRVYFSNLTAFSYKFSNVHDIPPISIEETDLKILKEECTADIGQRSQFRIPRF